MSLPRFIRPGRYWIVTRRTLHQMFLLLPEAWVRWLFEYALARACERTGVQVIGGVVMSTHFHVVVHDPGAQLPLFVQVLDELVARAGNAERGRCDYFWESRGARYTELLTTEAIEEAVVYCLTNPQEAGLVARASAWAGWLTLPAGLGRSKVVVRPALRFFGERCRLPAEIVLTLHVPPSHAGLGAERWRDLIARRLAKAEAVIEVARGGAGYLGMERVLAFAPTDVAESAGDNGGVQPLAKVGKLEQAPEAHEAYRALVTVFRCAHREAYLAMREGRAVVFPFGTYRWRLDGQRCERAAA